MNSSMTSQTINHVLRGGGSFKRCFRCDHLCREAVRQRARLFIEQLHDILMRREHIRMRMRLKPSQHQIWERTDLLLRRIENQLLDGLTDVLDQSDENVARYCTLIRRSAEDMDRHCAGYYGKDWSFLRVSAPKSCVVM